MTTAPPGNTLLKPHSFAITLQQYGYISTLLDLTEDLEVALYFTQAHMDVGQMRKEPPAAGRVVARIYLDSDVIETSISDDELFPSPADDLLYKTLRESRPELVGLY